MQTQTVSVYEALVKPASRWLEIPILLGFNLLLVATSYIYIHLPFSPVPITGQTFGVLVFGQYCLGFLLHLFFRYCHADFSLSSAYSVSTLC